MEITETNRKTSLKAPKRLSRKSSLKKRGKTKKRVKNAVQSISKLQKEADRLMSLYVRLSNADKEGICTCYTCGYRNHYKKMQNGHYISRFYKSRRYDLRNTRVQCSMCNMWRNGDIPTFRANLVKELGPETVSEIETGYKELTKCTREWYEQQISHFKSLLDTVENSQNPGNNG